MCGESYRDVVINREVLCHLVHLQHGLVALLLDNERCRGIAALQGGAGELLLVLLLHVRLQAALAPLDLWAV